MKKLNDTTWLIEYKRDEYSYQIDLIPEHERVDEGYKYAMHSENGGEWEFHTLAECREMAATDIEDIRHNVREHEAAEHEAAERAKAERRELYENAATFTSDAVITALGWLQRYERSRTATDVVEHITGEPCTDDRLVAVVKVLESSERCTPTRVPGEGTFWTLSEQVSFDSVRQAMVELKAFTEASAVTVTQVAGQVTRTLPPYRHDRLEAKTRLLTDGCYTRRIGGDGVPTKYWLTDGAPVRKSSAPSPGQRTSVLRVDGHHHAIVNMTASLAGMPISRTTEAIIAGDQDVMEHLETARRFYSGR